jgi:hypothetical protein
MEQVNVDALKGFDDATQGLLDEIVHNIVAGFETQLTETEAAHASITEKALGGVSDAMSTAGSVLSGALGGIFGGIDSARDKIDDVTSTLTGFLGNSISNPIKSIQDLYDFLVEKITSGISDAVGIIGNGLDTAQESITSAFNSGLDLLEDGIGSAFSSATDLISVPLSFITMGINDIAKSLTDIPKILAEKITEGTLQGANSFMSLMARDMIRDIPSLSESIKFAGESNPILSEIHGAIERNEGQLAGAMGMQVVGQVISTGIGQIIDQPFRPVGYAVANKLRNTIISPAECIYGVVKFPELKSSWYDRLHAYGFDDGEIELMVMSSQALLSASDYVSLWQRGKITEQDMGSQLQRLGLNDESISKLQTVAEQVLSYQDSFEAYRRGLLSDSELESRLMALGIPSVDVALHKELAFPIPGIQDLIRFAVREVFTPETRIAYGMDNDLPPDFVNKAKLVGLSEEWAKAYWAAHWELPSPSQGYEMLHRGLIGPEELDGLLKSLDYMPYWRDKLIQLNYNPITRVDLRRLYQLNVIDEVKLKRGYLDLGYNEENAGYLTEWTIKSLEKDSEDSKQANKDLTVAEVLSLYKESVIDRATTATMLSDCGYDENETEYKLTLAELAIYKDDKKLVLDTLKTKYQHGLLDYNGLVNELGKLNIPTAEAENYLVKWEKTTPINVKVPTNKEMGDMVKGGYLGSDEMYQEIRRQGYSEQWANKLVRLYSGKTSG